MQALSVLGPDADAVVGSLAERLDGRVALVKRAETADDGDPVTADVVFALSDDGAWTGAGTDRDFDDLLESLAPDVDYLVAAGHTRLRLPTVLVGDERDPADVPGDVIRQADSVDELDFDALAADAADLEPWITLSELIADAKRSPEAERAGAIATFTGRVRAKDAPDDDRTSHLAFEKYEGVAADRMEAIEAELEERDGVFDVLMHHRTGVVADGEDIVFVVVLAGHRSEAFATVEDGIDRLKDEVPIFKKETTEDEEFWVHQRPDSGA